MKVIILIMKKLSSFILAFCIFLAGCETVNSEKQSQFEKVSRQIDVIKLQAANPNGQNITITVNMLTTDSSLYSSVDALWQYVNTNVAHIHRPEVFHHSGLKIGIADNNFDVRFDIVKSKLRSSEESQMFLVLVDGSTGYISIGKEILIPRFVYFGTWYTRADYQFLKASKSLEATVTRLPSGLIKMKLTPVFSNFLNDGGDMELTELTTTITARPRQTVVIGGSDTSNESVANALFGYRRLREKKQTIITISAY